MPERFSIFTRLSRRTLTALTTVAAIALVVGIAGCSEDLSSGLACPTLCVASGNNFRDTTLDAVELDTTIAGFPTLGLATSLLLASRKDTVQSSIVIRFDSLPTSVVLSGATDTTTISGVDSAYLRIVIDSTGGQGASQAILQAYDVDSVTLQNPTPAQVEMLFRPDRLIGSVPVTPIAARDTIRIPLSNAALFSKLHSHSRVRIGLRLAGTTSAQLRIVAFNGGVGSPLISFDDPADTAYIPVGVAPQTDIAGATVEEVLSATVYSLADTPTANADAQTLVVGGYPSRRSYLRFVLPPAIIDSSTIVRAELVLSQRRSPGVDPTDSLFVVPLVSTATYLVTDIRRAMDLAAEGYFAGLDSLRLTPGDSGTQTLNVLSVVRTWSLLNTKITRAIILRSSKEGSQPAEARFFSSEGPPALRPKLRITYLPRVEGAIP
jgi:hypothetical protein